MNRGIEASCEHGLSRNIKKTKFIETSKYTSQSGELTINYKQIQRIITNYTYFEITINKQWDQYIGIKSRIEEARAH